MLKDVVSRSDYVFFPIPTFSDCVRILTLQINWTEVKESLKIIISIGVYNPYKNLHKILKIIILIGVYN